MTTIKKTTTSGYRPTGSACRPNAVTSPSCEALAVVARPGFCNQGQRNFRTGQAKELCLVSQQSDSNFSLVRLRAALERETSDGLALARDIGSNPICCITLDTSVPCIFIYWKDYASSLQFHFIHESIIDLLQRHRLTKLLGDDTSLPMIHAEDQAWVIKDWLPRAMSAGLRAVAHKSPVAYFGKLSVDNVRSGVAAKISLATFESLDEARGWLRGVGV
jgi:hypothetical protein